MPNDDEKTTPDERDDAESAPVTKPSGKRKKSGGDGFDSVPDDFAPEVDASRIPGKVAKSDKSAAAKPGRVAALGEKASQGKQVSFNLTPALLIKSVAALVAIALVVLLALGTYGWFNERGKREAGDAARNAGTNFVMQVTDTQHFDTMSARVGPLVTGKLKQIFSQQNADTVKQMQSLQLNTTTSIWSAGIVSASEKNAVVLVIAELTGTSVSASTQTSQLMMFRLTMEKHGDKWLVANSELPTNDGNGGTGGGMPGNSVPGANLPGDTNAPQTPAPTPTN